MTGLPRAGSWDFKKDQRHAGKLRTEPLPLKSAVREVNLTQSAQFPSELLNSSLYLEKLRTKEGQIWPG